PPSAPFPYTTLFRSDLSAAPSGTFSTATDHQILWTAEVAANNTNVIAVHEYDAVPVTAAMPKTLTTAGSSFANCDGVTFTSAPRSEEHTSELQSLRH